MALEAAIPHVEASEVHDLLRRALKRIQNPQRWHSMRGKRPVRRGDIGTGGAIDANGRQVEAVDPNAVRWCALGALKREDHTHNSPAGLSPLVREALKPLEAAAGGPIFHVNDESTHEQIVGHFQRAVQEYAARNGAR